MFMTRNDFIGLASGAMQSDDSIIYVHGYNILVALRPRKSSFYFVGFAYVYPARMYTAEESLTNP
jgi:hypothetical protein